MVCAIPDSRAWIDSGLINPGRGAVATMRPQRTFTQDGDLVPYGFVAT